MCDYSLMSYQSRPAKVGDKLKTHPFASGSTGFVDIGECSGAPTAVCVLPGTEIAFDNPIRMRGGFFFKGKPLGDAKVAIFRQVDKDQPHVHHDTLELPSGELVLLTLLEAAQTATVLQLPAAPKTEAEAEDQRRVEVVG